MIQCKICGRKPTENGTILKRTNTTKAKVAQFICRPGTGCRQKPKFPKAIKELFEALRAREDAK